MSSNAFGALYRLNVSIVCPSDLESSWSSSNTAKGLWGGWADCDGNTADWTGGQWVKSGADNLYEEPTGQFDFGAYHACWGTGSTNPGGNLKVKDAQKLVFSDVVTSNRGWKGRTQEFYAKSYS